MASSMTRFSALFQSLRSAAVRLAGTKHPVPELPRMPEAARPIVVAARPVARAGGTPPVQRIPRSPVRVLRVAEAGSRRVAGARMVISGRLADVCAELDRLAALEAAAP